MMSRLMTSLEGQGVRNIIPVWGYIDIPWTIAFDFSTNGGVTSTDTTSDFSLGITGKGQMTDDISILF